MGKRKKQTKFPEELLAEMATFDDPELPDFAWETVLTDYVHFYNVKNGTNFDPHEAFLAYCERNSSF